MAMHNNEYTNQSFRNYTQPNHSAMKQLSLSLIAVLLVFFCNAQQTPYLVKNFESTIREAEVYTSGGSIDVTHQAGEKNRIEVYVRGNNNRTFSKEEIEERLQNDYTLTIEVSGGKLYAKAETRKGYRDWKNSLSFSFKIYVPESVDTKLGTSGGSISLAGIKGVLKFSTSGGSLNLEKVGGELEGATSGGSINISNSKANGKLATSGGSINANTCEGVLQLATSGGSIKLNKLNGDFDAVTSGGSVTADDISGTLETSTSGGSMHLTNIKCALAASTSGGTIHAEITKPGKYIKLGNSSGNIELSLPANLGYDLDLRAEKISIPSLSNFSGDFTNESVKGQLNGGGIAVSAKSTGRITVNMVKYQ
jgi:DUF4097 and DUF4098 domain-containing protein YvlB